MTKARHMPHEKIRVTLTTVERRAVMDRVEQTRADVLLELTGAPAPLRARQLKGYVKRLQGVVDTLSLGLEEWTADELRLAMNLLGTGERTDAELAVYATLRTCWETEVV